MKALKLLFAGAALAAALTACKKEEATPIKPIVVPAPEVATPAAAPAAAATAAAAFHPFGPDIAVQTVTLGNTVGADNKIAAPGVSFAPTDTIYASVATKNASNNAALEAKWTYQDGQTVHDDSVAIAPKGDAFTAFHINAPKGLPIGTYKVEVSLNGQVVNTAAFEIKAAAPASSATAATATPATPATPATK